MSDKPSKSAKAMIDQLLDWHDQNKPGTPTEVRVRIMPSTARRFCKTAKNPDGSKYLTYSGRKIVAIGGNNEALDGTMENMQWLS